MGGNAVLGYCMNFDVEGDSGIVARAYGTACCICPSSPFLFLHPLFKGEDNIRSLSPQKRKLDGTYQNLFSKGVGESSLVSHPTENTIIPHLENNLRRHKKSGLFYQFDEESTRGDGVVTSNLEEGIGCGMNIEQIGEIEILGEEEAEVEERNQILSTPRSPYEPTTNQNGLKELTVIPPSPFLNSLSKLPDEISLISMTEFDPMVRIHIGKKGVCCL